MKWSWSKGKADGMVLGGLREAKFQMSFSINSQKGISLFKVATWQGGSENRLEFVDVPIESVEAYGITIEANNCEGYCQAKNATCSTCSLDPECGWCEATHDCIRRSAVDTVQCAGTSINRGGAACPACLQHTDCLTCAAEPGCGWVPSKNTCVSAWRVPVPGTEGLTALRLSGNLVDNELVDVDEHEATVHGDPQGWCSPCPVTAPGVFCGGQEKGVCVWPDDDINLPFCRCHNDERWTGSSCTVDPNASITTATAATRSTIPKATAAATSTTTTTTTMATAAGTTTTTTTITTTTTTITITTTITTTTTATTIASIATDSAIASRMVTTNRNANTPTASATTTDDEVLFTNGTCSNPIVEVIDWSTQRRGWKFKLNGCDGSNDGGAAQLVCSISGVTSTGTPYDIFAAKPYNNYYCSQPGSSKTRCRTAVWDIDVPVLPVEYHSAKVGGSHTIKRGTIVTCTAFVGAVNTSGSCKFTGLPGSENVCEPVERNETSKRDDADTYVETKECGVAGDASYAKNGTCFICPNGMIGNLLKTGCSYCPSGEVKFPSGDDNPNAVCVNAVGSSGCGVAGDASYARDGVCLMCPTGKVGDSFKIDCVDCPDGSVLPSTSERNKTASCIKSSTAQTTTITTTATTEKMPGAAVRKDSAATVVVVVLVILLFALIFFLRWRKKKRLASEVARAVAALGKSHAHDSFVVPTHNDAWWDSGFLGGRNNSGADASAAGLKKKVGRLLTPEAMAEAAKNAEKEAAPSDGTAPDSFLSIAQETAPAGLTGRLRRLLSTRKRSSNNAVQSDTALDMAILPEDAIADIQTEDPEVVSDVNGYLSVVGADEPDDHRIAVRRLSDVEHKSAMYESAGNADGKSCNPSYVSAGGTPLSIDRGPNAPVYNIPVLPEGGDRESSPYPKYEAAYSLVSSRGTESMYALAGHLESSIDTCSKATYDVANTHDEAGVPRGSSTDLRYDTADEQYHGESGVLPAEGAHKIEQSNIAPGATYQEGLGLEIYDNVGQGLTFDDGGSKDGNTFSSAVYAIARLPLPGPSDQRDPESEV